MVDSKIRCLKETGKRFANKYLGVYTPGSKSDILILSSPRSGSTWLMELLYAEPGMKYIFEPLGKNILDYNQLISIDAQWYWTSLSSVEKEELAKFFRDDNRLGHFGPRNPFRRDFNYRTTRRVIKIIRANSLIEWFADEFDYQIIYLFRHPIPQSLSSIKRDHKLKLSSFVEDDIFRDKFLDNDLVSFVNSLEASGAELEKFVCQWALDNLAPLSFISEYSDLLMLSYEELVLKTNKCVELIADRCDLSNKERILEKVNTPSKTADSTSEKVKQNIKKGESWSLIERWRGEVGERMEKDLISILEKFEINVYRFGSLLPSDHLLNFERIKENS